ncbi:MAG: ABC transporter ATP-binding protein [Desulfobacterales bacterium]|nr:ABC transporter ATP-binding protein [Desulfobacterales bacterium]
MSKVRLVSLSKSYGTIPAVKKLNLEINDEEFMVLIGATGCGKTTTLRLIAGLEQPDQGHIYIDNHLMNDVKVGQREVQMIFQNFALWPHMQVTHEKKIANMNFALKIRKWLDEDIKARIEDVVHRIGIDRELLSRKPPELSAGQKQKVAIGRAVVIPPKVFLMDEPMSNIDEPAKVKIRDEILGIHKQLRTTTLYVTHNMADAMIMADRIAVMQDGAILQVATPQEMYRNPANSYVADFVKCSDISFLRSMGR